MNKLRVLLADDHRIVTEALRHLLEPEFDLVGIVEDGRAMLEAARELKPDVVVVDISMPELNGLDALEELMMIDPDARVVVLTMHRRLVYARKALSLGALGYVLKHSAPDELVLAVRAAAAGKTFVTPELTNDLLQSLSSNRRPSNDPVENLTLRQREILRLLVEGHSAKVIARRLDISPRTVESHKYTMMEALGLTNSAELIRYAYKSGFMDV